MKYGGYVVRECVRRMQVVQKVKAQNVQAIQNGCFFHTDGCAKHRSATLNDRLAHQPGKKIRAGMLGANKMLDPNP